MVVVKLKGGLGNQLFQYAFARAMAIHYSTNSYLDISDYLYDNHRVKRSFDLNLFDIKSEVIRSIADLKVNFLQSLFRQEAKLNFFKEKTILYDNQVYDLKLPIHFDGYWQSFKYFDFMKADLQKELVLVSKNTKLQDSYFFRLKLFPSVAVHIRRGDYVTDEFTNQIHGVCSLEYYLNSIEYFKTKIPNVQFLIFSDDILYVKSIFGNVSNYIYVDGLDNHVEEFDLMKQCDHFIISNSTFSWWAAWICSNEDKEVIAPTRWYKDDDLQSKTKDLIPTNWLKKI